MEVGRFLVEAHLKEKGPVAELARQHGVHRSWLYKLIRRYKLEGESGVAPRSRRPHRSPTRIAASFEDEIVAIRKELTEHGFDAGATTIREHLLRAHSEEAVPSVSSIWRILRARGFVTPQPHKRPKSSYTRFVRGASERDLAVRHDPLAARGREPRRDLEHDRRPLEAVCRLARLCHRALARRRENAPQCGR